LPALEWNIGEENTQSARQQNEMANFIAATDAYDHPIVLHTFPQEQDKRFEPMLGKGSRLTGASLQNMWDAVHRRTLRWVKASKDSGRPWVCANDEQGAADQGVPPDPGYGGFDGAVTMKGGRKYDLHDIRKRTLWGNLMAGGGGVMYYFGYKLKQNDLRCQDFRSRDYCRHALNFLHEQNLPLAQMTNMNALVGNPNNQYGPWCLAEPNQVYLVYVPAGGKAELDLSDATGVYSLAHFNPREGGPLKMSAQTVAGGTKLTLAAPASGPEEDWVFLVQRTKRGGGGMNQHQLGNRSSAKH
jgi:hypothetical protein